jgi:hypothetical protein
MGGERREEKGYKIGKRLDMSATSRCRFSEQKVASSFDRHRLQKTPTVLQQTLGLETVLIDTARGQKSALRYYVALLFLQPFLLLRFWGSLSLLFSFTMTLILFLARM